MNVVLEWNQIALEGIRSLGKLPSNDADRARGGPPQVARTLGIIHTAIYNAWTAYNSDAVAVYGTVAKRPATEHANESVKKIAISEAAYRAIKDQLPLTAAQAGRVAEVKAFLDDLEAYYAKTVTAQPSSSANTAAKNLGNTAAALVTGFRQNDGANEANLYADNSGYQSVNTPVPVAVPATADGLSDPDRWQALSYLDAEHILRAPGFIAPHWGGVTPFAMASGNQFRPAKGPHTWLTQAYLDQAKHVIDVQKHLTIEQKVIAEYWADGPNSSLPPGHWTEFASFVAERPKLNGFPLSGKLTLDETVKLFFALSNAIFDASIAVWDTKRAYDSVRPVTAIRFLFSGQTIKGWAGPGQGVQDMRGEHWMPFQKSTFPTPPFSEFVSGHSGFSMAAATVLKMFTGSDQFGFLYTQDKRLAADPGEAVEGVTLSWSTFTEAARQAGGSRIYGGIHFYEGNVVGLDMGQKVGKLALEKAQAYWSGTV